MQDLITHSVDGSVDHPHRNEDRILELEKVGKTLSTAGLVDDRLFKGENKLHAVMDEQTTLWSLKYEKGVLPPVFVDQRFTSFKKLYEYADAYFTKRNIKIKEVLD